MSWTSHYQHEVNEREVCTLSIHFTILGVFCVFDKSESFGNCHAETTKKIQTFKFEYYCAGFHNIKFFIVPEIYLMVNIVKCFLDILFYL